MTAIERFTHDLLSRHGAIVERRREGLDVVAGPGLVADLGLAEYQRLVFTPEGASDEPETSIRVDYDSPLVEKMGALTERLGRAAAVRGPEVAPRTLDPQEQVDRALTLHNGVYRLIGMTPATSTCVGILFEYEILADEREGGLTTVWVSPATRSTPRLDSRWGSDEWQDGPPADLASVNSDIEVPWPIAVSAARARLAEPVAAFLDSLARRRDRDAERLRDYSLEIDRTIRSRLARRTIGPETRRRERDRLEATWRSYRARLADVIERYRVRVRLLPRGVIVTTIPVQHIAVRLMRRAASSDIVLAWNPLDGRLETRCCDACLSPTSAAWLCDERVHFLCGACFDACPVCGRRFCRACRAACPRTHEPAPQAPGRRQGGDGRSPDGPHGGALEGSRLVPPHAR